MQGKVTCGNLVRIKMSTYVYNYGWEVSQYVYFNNTTAYCNIEIIRLSISQY